MAGDDRRAFDAWVDPARDTTVVVRGEIDIATAGLFEAAVSEVARPGRAVVIDLTDTTFIDSTGLSVLVRLASTLSDPPDPDLVVLESLRPAVRKTLRVSGLDRLVTIRDT
jgi:anti-sigma B factor antagonist